MAQVGIRWLTGFEETSTIAQLLESPAGGNINTSSLGRTGTNCVSFGNNTIIKLIPGVDPATTDNLTTVVTGVAFNFQSNAIANNSQLVAFLDSTGANQCDVRITVGGTLFITRNGTTIAAASGFTVPLTGYFDLEFKAVLSTAATGSVEVRVNGVTFTQATNVVTAVNTSGAAKVALVGQAVPSGILADDWYIADDDFHGDLRMTYVYPNSDGTYAEWTPNSGVTHNNRVSEHPPDDNTTYISAGAPSVGQRDTFGTAGVSFTGSIEAIATVIRAEKDDASTQQYQHMLRSGGNDFFSVPIVNLALGSYNYTQKVWNTDPNTGSKFTQTNFNSAEPGVIHNFPAMADTMSLSDGTAHTTLGATIQIVIN